MRRLLGALLGLACLEACGGGPDELEVRFMWIHEAPAAAEGYWVWLRVEERPVADTRGAILAEISPHRWEGQTIDLAEMGRIPNGPDRVIIVELRQSATTAELASTHYYGQSEPQQIPGPTSVEVGITRHPSEALAGHAPIAIEGRGGTRAGYVGDPSAAVIVRGLDGAAGVVVANDLGFQRGMAPFSFTGTTEQPPGAATIVANADDWRIEPWSLNEGLCTGAGCVDGPRGVYVMYRDSTYGTLGRVYSAQVVIDDTPPHVTGRSILRRCDARAAAQAAVDRLYVRNDIELGDPGCLDATSALDDWSPKPGCSDPPLGSVSLQVTFSEAIDLDALSLFVARPSGTRQDFAVDWCRSDETATGSGAANVVTAFLRPTGDSVAEDGEVPVRAMFRDLAGNTQVDGSGDPVPEVEVARLIFDNTTPAPPNVDVPGSVVYERWPTGTASTTENGIPIARYAVRGSAGAAEPGATVIAYDRTTEVNAARLGSVVASTSDGSFSVCADDVSTPASCPDGMLLGNLSLARTDRAAVYLRVEDAAGNTSDDRPSTVESEAAPVLDVEWTVTIGTAADNPHTLSETPAFPLPPARATVLSEGAAVSLVEPDCATAASCRAMHRLGNQVTVVASPGGPSPQPSTSHAMAYDPVHGRAMLAVGTTPTDQQSWQYSPSEGWELVCSSANGCNSPTLAAAFGEDSVVVFDRAIEQTLLIGGLIEANVAPTWRWTDAKDWEQTCATYADCPNLARTGSAAVYDSARRRVVLFGGYNGLGYGHLGDTWEWDGETWWQVCGPLLACPGPSNRRDHAMAYDESRGVTVLMGGSDGSPYDDAWEWDGQAWSLVCDGSACAAPPPRAGHGMVFAGQEVLATGGTATRDAWLWNGARWKLACDEAAGCPGPPATSGDSLTYDPELDVVYLVPGDSAQTWAWESASESWRQLCTGDASCGPQATRNDAIVFDSNRGRAVLYIGSASSGDETWEWDGTAWHLVCGGNTGCSGPPARLNATLVYDLSAGHAVLFGGSDPSGVDSAQTWTWNGASWSLACDPTAGCSAPDGRSAVAMAYDPIRDRTIMTGGASAVVAFRDTWEWDGTSWQQVCDGAAACTSPATSWHSHRGVFDVARGVPIFAGAEDQSGLFATWEWDGSSWSCLCGCADPCMGTDWQGNAVEVPWQLGRFVYDSTRQRALFTFGAALGASAGIWEWNGLDATWRLACGGPTGCRVPEVIGGVMTYDEARARVLFIGGTTLAGGSSTSSTLQWDPTSAVSRPAQIATARFAMADGPEPWACFARDCSIHEVSVDWYAGGRGFAGGVAESGVDLYVWQRGRWSVMELGANAAPPEAPARTTWSTADDLQLAQIFAGSDRELRFAVAPKAAGEDPAGLAEVATDYVEVRVDYSLRRCGDDLDLSSCGGACVDLETSTAHCGGCDQPCEPGETCAAGECSCAAEALLCDGACTPVLHEDRTCGDCSTVCSGTEACQGGSCCDACNLLRGAVNGSEPAGSARVVEISGYGGAAAYKSDLTASCAQSLQPSGTLCDEGGSVDDATLSTKSAASSGATWWAPSGGTGVLVVDLGAQRSIATFSVFQSYSLGLTTHIRFSFHDAVDSPPGGLDPGWRSVSGSVPVGPGTDSGGAGGAPHMVADPTDVALAVPETTRFVRIEARNDGSVGHADYIQLRSVKAFSAP